jgi:hypothetical protein
MKPRKQPCILGLFDILQNYFTEEATVKSLEDFFALLKGLCQKMVWAFFDLHEKVRSRPEKIAAVYLIFCCSSYCCCGYIYTRHSAKRNNTILYTFHTHTFVTSTFYIYFALFVLKSVITVPSCSTAVILRYTL